MKGHISTVHERQKPFKCESCDHTSGNKQNLDRHRNSVHEKNIFSCTKCNRGFTRKDERNKHEGSCLNKFMIICPEQDCEKKFSKKDTLKEHLFTHSGEKLFSCTMCPGKFSGLKGKNRHIKDKSCNE